MPRPRNRPKADPAAHAERKAQARAAPRQDRQPGSVATFSRVDLDGAVVLLAFPTAGSASSIAAQYLVRKLSLPLVGHFLMPELSGLIAIQDGRVTSAVRIFGGEVACRIGKDCPRIYLVTTELPLPPTAMAHVGRTVMEWASRGGAHMLLVLEAVVRAEGDDSPDVFVAAAEPKVLKTLREVGLEPMPRALIAGITAQLLLDSPAHGLNAAGLLVEASRDHPDGRAAVALVEAVAKLVPDVHVDAGPLLAEAMELEKQIQRAQQQATRHVQPSPATFI